jgi:hypothetical protein
MQKDFSIEEDMREDGRLLFCLEARRHVACIHMKEDFSIRGACEMQNVQASVTTLYIKH